MEISMAHYYRLWLCSSKLILTLAEAQGVFQKKYILCIKMRNYCFAIPGVVYFEVQQNETFLFDNVSRIKVTTSR